MQKPCYTFAFEMIDVNTFLRSISGLARLTIPRAPYRAT